MQPAASAPNGSTTSASAVPLIEARDLTKQFGGLRAVDGMSIALGHGEMLGLIGPNGAGKTTLFNLLAGSLKPTSGTISIGGSELSRRRSGSAYRAGRRPHLPDPAAVSRDDGAGERADRRPGPGRRAYLDEFPAAGPCRRAGEGRGREGARPARLRHALGARGRAGARAVGRPAQAARTGAHPDGRSRRRSCSTSRRPASTRRCSNSSSTACSTSMRAGNRSC